MMTETQFVEQNKEKWEELENLLKSGQKDPDRLESLFIKVSSDLSYARTFFPNRSVRVYLNGLTQQVFDQIQKKKSRLNWTDLKTFFTLTLPFELYRSRKYLLISLCLFISSMLIGIVSSIDNPEFTAIILGDGYVQMTEENINSGDPMAVYKDHNKSDMFVGITVNNIRVAFLTFIMGIFASIGTLIVTVYNGVMVGTFQYFFYSKGLFMTSFLTIWIHGTLEISAIIIASGAGLLLGSGLLFPGTYSRMASLQISVRRALRIILSTVPIFIVAGFLESFATRHTAWPDAFKMFIIILSALIILYIYFIYPILQKNKYFQHYNEFQITPFVEDDSDEPRFKYRQLADLFTFSLTRFRKKFIAILSIGVLPIAALSGLIFWLFLWGISDQVVDTSGFSLFKGSNGHPILFILYWISVSHILVVSAIYSNDQIQNNQKVSSYAKGLPVALISSLIWLSIFFFVNNWVVILALMLVPPHFIFALIEGKASGQSLYSSNHDYFNFGYETIFKCALLTIVCCLFYLVIYVMINSVLFQFLSSYLYWHEWIDHWFFNSVLINSTILFSAFLICIPLFFFVYSDFYISEYCREHATDLKERFKSFGISNSLFEQY